MRANRKKWAKSEGDLQNFVHLRPEAGRGFAVLGFFPEPSAGAPRAEPVLRPPCRDLGQNLS